MPNVKINQANYDNKLNDWKNSATNRGDILYFVSDEICERDIQQIAWKIGLIIKIETIGFLSKITFLDILI
jgi:hypothetical protein